MSRRIIDISIAIESGLPSDPEMMIPEIDYIDHARGAEQMTMFFPGLKKEDLPKGLGWAVEFVRLSTHSGTHLDAPAHYHPFMDKGKPAMTIDEIPLKWCFCDGVLLDFSHKADGEAITADDVREKLANLDAIPVCHGFTVACFPVKIKSASAGWRRPVAIVED